METNMVYAIYVIQVNGFIGSKSPSLANKATPLCPEYVVETLKEAEHACEANRRDGLLSWFFPVPIAKWTDKTMREMKKRWSKKNH